jgi:hypothetical protein
MPGFGSSDHQVARVVVAVHVHLALRQIVGEDGVHAAFQPAFLFVIELNAEVLVDVPVFKQIHLALQQRLVVGRQFVWPWRQAGF